MRDNGNRTEENSTVGRTKSKRTGRISEHLTFLYINAKSMRSYLADLEVLKQDQNYESAIIGPCGNIPTAAIFNILFSQGKGRKRCC